LHWLCRDLGYEVIVAVVMQERDVLPFGDSGDQQVWKADCHDLPAVPLHGLHIKRPNAHGQRETSSSTAT